MAAEKCCSFVEWRIENLSHWCAEVHGECIESPRFFFGHCAHMELYPKGVSGIEEQVLVCFCSFTRGFSCDFSICCSNGTLLCQQTVNAKNTPVLEILPGPKFEDVLSRIRESEEDFITVRLRIKDSCNTELRVCTIVNVLKVSLKISPNCVEKLKSGATKKVLSIHLFPNDFLDEIYLETCGGNDTVHFKITPDTKYEYPFAVEMCVSLTGSDGTVDNRVKKEHVFRDDKSPWTFPEPLQKKELVGKGISLLLCLKTKNLIQNPSYVIWDNSNVSIQPNNTLCLTERGESSADAAVTSGKDSVAAVVTNDSESQTSDMPDDSVLSKDLMCLYQDQDFSDITLKCDNVSFPVHRAILSARSPVFKTMLSTDMTEAASGTVDIGDLDPSTLGLFLAYLYTGAVEDLQCDRALKLYYAADKYQVPSLKGECANFLCDNVSLSNVCDILSLAHKHQNDNLTTVSRNFILNHFNEVLASKEWKSFMSSEPLLALETLTYFGEKGFLGKLNPQ